MKITHSLVTDVDQWIWTNRISTQGTLFFLFHQECLKSMFLWVSTAILSCVTVDWSSSFSTWRKFTPCQSQGLAVDTHKNLLRIQEHYNIWQWRPAPYSKTRKSPLKQCSIMIYINQSSLSNMWQHAVRNTICSGRVRFWKPTRNITSNI